MKKKMLFLLFALLNSFYLSGCSSNVPYIGENGNWWINSTDLCVPAKGPKGDTGQKAILVQKEIKEILLMLFLLIKSKLRKKMTFMKLFFQMEQVAHLQLQLNN